MGSGIMVRETTVRDGEVTVREGHAPGNDEPGIHARAEALGLVARRATWKVGDIHAVFGKGHEIRERLVEGWHIHCPFDGFICGNVVEREAHVLLRGFEAGLRHAGKLLLRQANTPPLG